MWKRVCPLSCNRTLQIQDRHYPDPPHLPLPLWLLWRNCHLFWQESEFYHLYCSWICRHLVSKKSSVWFYHCRRMSGIMTWRFRYIQLFDISWNRQFDCKNLQGRRHQLMPVRDSRLTLARKRAISAIKCI